jgi:serine O-acetyltransferase
MDDRTSVWARIRAEAQDEAAGEPLLEGIFADLVTSRCGLGDALCATLARHLGCSGCVERDLYHLLSSLLTENATIEDAAAFDLLATHQRDPACTKLVYPLLYYKGYHALQCARFSHAAWRSGREAIARYLQSRASQVFSVDIHPAARIGRGVFLDHATGIVIGETAEIGDNVSLLHEVTLGGTGKERGDRHPKLRAGVLIGAGAKILGNIVIGEGAKVGAGSVVVRDVAPHATVVGVPARAVGITGARAGGASRDEKSALELCPGVIDFVI